MKKYWDDHFAHSSHYDALERRAGIKGIQKPLPLKRAPVKDEKENVSPAITKSQAPYKRAVVPTHTPTSVSATKALANATSSVLNSKQKQLAAVVPKKSKQTGTHHHFFFQDIESRFDV